MPIIQGPAPHLHCLTQDHIKSLMLSAPFTSSHLIHAARMLNTHGVHIHFRTTSFLQGTTQIIGCRGWIRLGSQTRQERKLKIEEITENIHNTDHMKPGALRAVDTVRLDLTLGIGLKLCKDIRWGHKHRIACTQPDVIWSVYAETCYVFDESW